MTGTVTGRLADWGLHRKAHRGAAAACAVALLHLVAIIGSGIEVPLMTLTGALETPLVALMGLLVAPVAVGALEQRTRLEAVSTRRLRSRGELAVWLAALVPALATTALGSPIHLRALLAAIGLTMLVWQWWPSPLATLPAVLWLILSLSFARVAPGLPWWGCFVYEGDARTWVAPVALAVLAWTVSAVRTARD